MTKVEAIKALMKEYNGVISLKILYSEIEKYYPDAKKSEEWQAGLRGVLYRDLGKSFKRLDGSLYSLLIADCAASNNASVNVLILHTNCALERSSSPIPSFFKKPSRAS